ncbi:MAG TPA: DUF881 domain-containing protein [Nocardioides sp.]|jgi:uncharacterized protein YlxW (UPF0749 family)|nr:DUF881 domain-containing protein [Nocardioides sp.]
MAEAPTLPRPGTPDGERPLPEHVTEPLLALITKRSLDADYEHVAARRRALGRDPESHPVPRRTAGLVLLVFGLLVTIAAVQTSRNASANDAGRESLIEQVDLRRQGVSELQKQLDRQQSQVFALQSELNSLATERQATQARLERLGIRTGFGAVSGPGVQVTVNSAPGSAGSELVRDSDLTLLTDALWAAGAEAISVNGQRLTVLSAFRNVGIGILVNSQPINPPYVFSVVGNPDTLPANLLASSMGEKWYALKDSLGFRFDVRNGGTMSLPAAQQQRLRSAQIATPDTGHTRTQGDSAP